MCFPVSREGKCVSDGRSRILFIFHIYILEKSYSMYDSNVEYKFKDSIVICFSNYADTQRQTPTAKTVIFLIQGT